MAKKKKKPAKRLKASKKPTARSPMPGEIRGGSRMAALPNDAASLAAALHSFVVTAHAHQPEEQVFSGSRIRGLLKTWDPHVWKVLAEYAERIPSLDAVLTAEASELLDPHARRSFETTLAQRGFVYVELLPVASPAVLRMLTKTLPVMFNMRFLPVGIYETLAEGYGGDLVIEEPVLSEAMAAALARHRGRVSVTNCSILEDTDAHVALLGRIVADHQGSGLRLGFTMIPERAYAVFRDFDGPLSLAVRGVSDAAAVCLATIRGLLDLSHVSELSAQAVKNLAAHRGDLLLSSIKEIPRDAVAGLAEHHGFLDLKSLRLIDHEGAEALAKHDGFVLLEDLERLHSVALAKKIAVGFVTFRELTDVSDDVMAALSQSDADRLAFCKLGSLSDTAAAFLAQAKCGSIVFDSLDVITDDAARSLAAFPNNLTVEGAAKTKVARYRK